ncbi:hypothetical protein B0H16DRAFT_1697270 [Mycena metata]|uniref:F-box domain-containing protein n=1 Tax=Mycena metata TaxID=1033252 RepID=A0AAD7MRU9_9AGAR|nr:hypothetical protein B0H16DRAFT_1697270 [Mycena metata]
MIGIIQTPLPPVPHQSAVSPPPDLLHLLRSNEPPQEAQIPVIRGIISDDKNRISLMDAEIVSLQSQIHNLNATLAQSLQKRNDAQLHALQHRSILSPIRRVPPELISEIFNRVCGGEPGKRLPWYLGHISRSWRHTALSLAHLWSSITVELHLSKTDVLLASIEEQLRRAAHVPLDVHFPDVRTDMDAPLLNLILRHSSRWGSLYLNRRRRLSHDTAVLDWLRPIEGHLEQLVRLEVPHYWITIPDIFSTAPRLREVMLTDHHLRESPSSILIPWQQITHYRGTYGSGRQLEILEQSPNLLECALGFQGALSVTSNTTPTLPHLRRLTLDLHTAVGNITAPVLEDLLLSWSNPQALAWAQPLLFRCSSTLQRLALRQSIICMELIPVLRGLPLLAHLVLEYGAGTGDAQTDFFNALSTAAATSEPPVCPNLTSIVYGYRFKGRSSKDAFFAMARSRFRPISADYRPLSCLRLYAARYTLSDSMLSRMALLKDQGFDAAFLDERESEFLGQNLFLF